MIILLVHHHNYIFIDVFECDETGISFCLKTSDNWLSVYRNGPVSRCSPTLMTSLPLPSKPVQLVSMVLIHSTNMLANVTDAERAVCLAFDRLPVELRKPILEVSGR